MAKVLQKTEGKWKVATYVSLPDLEGFLDTDEGQDIYQMGWEAMEASVLNDGDCPINPFRIGTIEHLAYTEGCGDYEPPDEDQG